jgi:hypothetical protein
VRSLIGEFVSALRHSQRVRPLRRRGCSGSYHDPDPRHRPVPAQAGMLRTGGSASAGTGPGPRAGGDDPRNLEAASQGGGRSPAQAGMLQSTGSGRAPCKPGPCASGYVPMPKNGIWFTTDWSPHRRGRSVPRPAQCSGLNLIFAQAGMLRIGHRPTIRAHAVPCASGDAPAYAGETS